MAGKEKKPKKEKKPYYIQMKKHLEYDSVEFKIPMAHDSEKNRIYSRKILNIVCKNLK